MTDTGVAVDTGVVALTEDELKTKSRDDLLKMRIDLFTDMKKSWDIFDAKKKNIDILNKFIGTMQ